MENVQGGNIMSSIQGLRNRAVITDITCSNLLSLSNYGNPHGNITVFTKHTVTTITTLPWKWQ